MNTYRFREGFMSKVPAQVVGPELDRIRDERGELTPHAVLDEARDAASPLHGCFEWNDEVAAHAHRLEQSRRLVRSVEVVYEGADRKSYPAYVSVRTEEGRRYVPPRELSADDLRDKVVAEALERANAMLGRYRKYVELANFFAEMDAAAAKLKQKRKARARTAPVMAEAVV